MRPHLAGSVCSPKLGALGGNSFKGQTGLSGSDGHAGGLGRGGGFWEGPAHASVPYSGQGRDPCSCTHTGEEVPGTQPKAWNLLQTDI